MSLYRRFAKKIEYSFLRKVKPEIIGGFLNKGGKRSLHTGVSNMTHISQQSDNLFIGENVFIGHFNYIDAYNGKVRISDNVQITNYVSVLTHSSHDEIRFSNSRELDHEAFGKLVKSGDVSIGENTYIGPHTVIMPGTTIGRNCIVSAYSYLKGDFPDNAIIRGTPATMIGSTLDRDGELMKNFPMLKKRQDS